MTGYQGGASTGEPNRSWPRLLTQMLPEPCVQQTFPGLWSSDCLLWEVDESTFLWLMASFQGRAFWCLWCLSWREGVRQRQEEAPTALASDLIASFNSKHSAHQDTKFKFCTLSPNSNIRITNSSTYLLLTISSQRKVADCECHNNPTCEYPRTLDTMRPKP